MDLQSLLRGRRLGAVALLMSSILTACGGGDAPENTSAAPSPDVNVPQAIAKTTVLLPGSATSVTRTETTVYQDDYESTAFHWGVNAWSEEGSSPRWVVERNTNAANAHAGSGSAHFRVDERAAVFPLGNFTFANGKRYKVTAWIKSDSAAGVELMARGGGPGYYPYAIVHLNASTTWQQVSIEGLMAEEARLFVTAPVGVNVYLDDLKIVEVRQDEFKPQNTASPIPDTMFGLHMNKLGAHNSWPGIGQKVLRLHDTGTHWCNLETAPGVWDFGRLDYHVAHVQSKDPQTQMIYTMGQTPAFASSKPGAASFYCTSSGESAPPADMQQWTNYVSTLGQRYKGKIKYWEIWNEWDIPQVYSGSVEQMVEMTRIARTVLKGIDPSNVILAPSITARLGTFNLERFLKAGGGQYVDIINLHTYEPGSPERMLGSVANVRSIMAANNVASLPLWDTEGGFGCDPVAQPGCVNASTLSASELSNPLRGLLLLWASGVSNFNYYHWEGGTATGALVYGTWEDSTPSNCTKFIATQVKYNPDCATPLGQRYAQAVSWLKGATLSELYTAQGLNGRIFIAKMALAGKMRVLMWSEGGEETVRLHKEKAYFAGTTWDTLKYQAPLDGVGVKSQIPQDVLSGTITLYRYVKVGPTPVLLTTN